MATSISRAGIRAAASLAALGAGLVAAILYCAPITVTRTLDGAAFALRGGHAYSAPVPGIAAGFLAPLFGADPDSNSAPSRSRLVLLENGRALGPPHTLHVEVEQVGGGRFSHWGSDIIFSSSDNTNPAANGRTYAIRYPLAPSYLVPLMLVFCGVAGLMLRPGATGADGAALGTLAARARDLRSWLHARRALAFWAIVAAFVAYSNVIVFSLLSAPVPSPDSAGYLIWSVFRTVGYPAFLSLYRAVLPGWEYLPLVQLNLLLASVAWLAYAIARTTGSYALGWVTFCLVAGAGTMLLSAADLLTEPLFSAALTAHLAFMCLAINGSGRIPLALAGLTLAAAITLKSVAVVMLGPLALLVIAAPALRRRLVILVLAPALAAWAAPSAWNAARDGYFEGSFAGGYALGGHVADAIRWRPGTAYPEEARRIEERLAPVLAKRPERFRSMSEYATYTANEYNTLLWHNIVPELSTYYGPAVCPSDHFVTCTWWACPKACVPRTNRTLLQLSREAIRAEPGKYAYHVLAHKVELWRSTFAAPTDFLSGIDERAAHLPKAYDPASNSFAEVLGPLPPFKSAQERAEIVAGIRESPGTRLVDLLMAGRIFESLLAAGQRVASVVLAIALLASFSIFAFRRLSPAGAALCYASLCLNAYFLGTALAQPVLVRYAWTVQSAAAAMLVLAAYVCFEALARRWKR